MIIKSAQAVTVGFTTSSPSTGAATNADSLPTGTLYVDGTADAATVTVTNITTGRYKAAVTLPTLSAGVVVSIHVAATVGGVTGGGFVWQAIGDTVRLSDSTPQTGDSYARIGAAGAGLTAVAVGAGGITAASIATGAVDADALAADAVAEIADAVWDELLSGHVTEGSAGHYLTDAGSAADPLMNAVPGSYSAGSAGSALGRISQGQISVLSLVSIEGNITELIGGATYTAAAGTAFSWVDADDAWPTITGATITVSLAHPDGQTASYTGSVVTGSGTGKTVRLELTAAQSAALQALNTGRWSLMIWATQSGGAVIPLVGGYANVKDQPGP